MVDQQSEYHDIVKPEQGKDPWSTDYYDYVDTVDANLKLSGVIGDRPTTANAPDNAWYEATDQNLIYRNDPTNGWVVIGHGDENNPVPEGHFNSLSTDDSLTDPAGVEHTGELADDGDSQPPENHGDSEHDNTVPSQSEVDGKADDPHGNASHSSTFAVDGDSQPPETHDNTAHTESYSTTTPSDVDSVNWGDYEIQKNGSDTNGVINFKT